MRKITLLALCLSVLPFQSFAGVKLYMRSTQSPITPSGDDVTARNLATSAGASLTAVRYGTTAGPVSPTQMTVNEVDDQKLSWVSSQLQAVVISGDVTFSIWGYESSGSANSTLTAALYQTDAVGTISATIIAAQTGHSELGTTSGAITWTLTPSGPVTLAEGDRLMVRIFVDDAGGNMASGYRTYFRHNANTAGADGFSYVEVTESIAAVAFTPTFTSTHTKTATPTPGPTNTWTPTGTYTVTKTATVSATNTPTASVTSTATVSVTTTFSPTVMPHDYSKVFTLKSKGDGTDHLVNENLAPPQNFQLMLLSLTWQNFDTSEVHVCLSVASIADDICWAVPGSTSGTQTAGEVHADFPKGIPLGIDTSLFFYTFEAIGVNDIHAVVTSMDSDSFQRPYNSNSRVVTP